MVDRRGKDVLRFAFAAIAFAVQASVDAQIHVAPAPAAAPAAASAAAATSSPVTIPAAAPVVSSVPAVSAGGGAPPDKETEAVHVHKPECAERQAWFCPAQGPCYWRTQKDC